ncbi:MAG: SDR family NAD(P)-dependent oxidoreductase [Gammaproteobacteria bacterium]|nr:SDR family NAD(P)-dependent oxidoreductase [Gammaproteobacteria bacterium]
MSAESPSPVKRALQALEAMQAKLQAVEFAAREPIAVIGVGCRFPGGVDSPESFWRLLSDGIDAITEVPPDRWDADAFYHPQPQTPGKICNRHGGFIDGVREFDAAFFGIAPREAASLDPQQRLMLELSWEALEHAGIAPSGLMGRPVGVYTGLSIQDYWQLMAAQAPTDIDAYLVSGGAGCVAAGRLSYLLGLKGPSLTVDTACSSSLVAVHLACQSLRGGECEMALAGGVNLILSPQNSIALAQAGMLAPDGRCKAFAASADGYVRAEGGGVVVLKRLSDALAAGDLVLAVIKGSAVNQDGRSSGLTVPNGPSQQAVIRAALANAELNPEQIAYVEAHGTGTALGDPLEAQALGEVFGANRSASLWLGSVKTNLGHLESAAGIAGLIKVVLALAQGEIPPSLHCAQPSPRIDWSRSPLRVPSVKQPWPPGPRAAGVSSFGFSGANAHVVLAQAPATANDEAPFRRDRPVHLLALSATTEAALGQLADRYRIHLDTHPDTALADVCHTANVGRTHFPQRLAIVSRSHDDCREKLLAAVNGRSAYTLWRGLAEAEAQSPVMLFSGQGSQYPGMGRELFDTQPRFRRTLEQCDAILQTLWDRSLLEILYPPADTPSPLSQTAYTQPALFALEYALADLWQSWGIRPGAVMGHSVGEYVAACVAGVFSLEDGLRLIAARGRLMQNLPDDGGMAAVFAPPETVAEALTGHAAVLSIAAVNAPENVVLSGRRDTLRTVTETLAARGIRATFLDVSHAFHSPLMEPMLAEFEQVLHAVRLTTPRLPLVSNLSGRFVAAGEVDTPAYWLRHVRQPVRFADGMNALAAAGHRVLLEIGPKPTLLGLGQQNWQGKPALWLPSLRAGQSDWQTLIEALAQLYVDGASVDWAAFDRDCARRRVRLPTYPFQRQTYWLKPAASVRPAMASGSADHPLRGPRLSSPLRQYQARISADEPDYLRDHRVFDRVMLPASAFVEMALSIAAENRPGAVLQLEEILFTQALTLSAESATVLQTVLTANGSQSDGFDDFQIFSRDEAATDETWRLHASGRISVNVPSDRPNPVRLRDIEQRCGERLSGAELYRRFRSWEVDFGSAFQGVEWLLRGTDEALGRIASSLASTGPYALHPALLDACLQVMGLLLGGDGDTPNVLVEVRRLRFYQRPEGAVWSHVRVRRDALGEPLGEVRILDDAGQVLVAVDGARCRPATRRTLFGNSDRPLFHRVQWQPADLPVSRYPATPATIHEALRPGLEKLAGRYDPDPRLPDALERLSQAYVRHALRALNPAAFAANRRFDLDGLMRDSRIEARYRLLLNRLLMGLERSGLLQRQRDERPGEVVWAFSANLPPVPPIPPDAAEVRARHPTASAELTLLERCGGQLADVLNGRRDPLDLLFPDGRLDDITRLFEESPGFRAMNELLRDAVGQALAGAEHGHGWRILELGAGTGATTAAVLPALPDTVREYVFTDVSPLFTARAETRFKDYPFLRYRLLDLETDPLAQGFAAQSFDLIIAANVVHATRDLRRTLNRIQSLLAPGGLLMLLEVTAAPTWANLVYGLTDGWWAFADHDLRPDYPLLSAERWRRLLSETPGFAEVRTLSLDAPGLSVEQAVVIAQRESAAEPATGRRWCLFADAQGVGERLAETLEATGHRCVRVLPGAAYRWIDGQRLMVNPTERQDFSRLLQDLGAEPVHRIVHLWSLDNPAPETLDTDGLIEATTRQTASALHLVQALLERQPAEIPALDLVTYDGLPVDDPGFAPTAASLAGLGTAIGREHPELRCRLIDLSSRDPDLAPALLNTLLASGEGSEEQLALRGDRRYRPVLTATEIGRTRSFTPRPEAAYLITGGLRGMGLAVASRLLERGARHLVLVGRGAPSPETQSVLDYWRERGAELTVAQADVADFAAMEKLLGSLPKNGPLAGIVHCAGVFADRLLAEHRWDLFEQVFAPKIAGSWNLHRLTRGRPLDFFVMFSSVATLLGDAGLGNYIAANAFQDALAHYRQRLGLPGLSINWGPWENVGMAAAVGRAREAQWQAQGIGLLDLEAALDALETLLSQDAPQVGVMRLDERRFLRQFTERGIPPLYRAWADAATPTTAEQRAPFSARLEKTAPSERLPLLRDHVCQLVGQVLGFADQESLDLRRGFFELGMDSLTAVELRNRLQASLDCTLPTTLTFKYPSIAALVDYLAETVLQLARPPRPDASEASDAAEPPTLSEAEVEQSIDREIAELEALLSAGDPAGEGGESVGR